MKIQKWANIARVVTRDYIYTVSLEKNQFYYDVYNLKLNYSLPDNQYPKIAEKYFKKLVQVVDS